MQAAYYLSTKHGRGTVAVVLVNGRTIGTLSVGKDCDFDAALRGWYAGKRQWKVWDGPEPSPPSVPFYNSCDIPECFYAEAMAA
jgi:hypothetical protein